MFIASKDSECVARIFVEAGVQHVIYTNPDVDSNSLMTFTGAFYDAVFSNDSNICHAFFNA